MCFLLWFTWCDNEGRVVWLNCLFWWGRSCLHLEISERIFFDIFEDVHIATTMLDFHTFDWYYFISVFIYKFFLLNSLNLFEFRLLEISWLIHHLVSYICKDFICQSFAFFSKVRVFIYHVTHIEFLSLFSCWRLSFLYLSYWCLFFGETFLSVFLVFLYIKKRGIPW